MLSKIFKSYKTSEQRKQNRKELYLGLISGILLGISFPPIPLPYLVFIALIPYFIVIEQRRSLAEVNRFTYFTVFFFNLITLYWVGSWTKDADPFLMIAGTVLMFFNPIVFLIPTTLYYFARERINSRFALYLLPWFWLFYEYIYSVSDFKFPWLSLGNSLPYFTTYIQIADIFGSYGLTLLIIYVNIFGYLTFKKFLRTKKICKLNISLFAALILLPLIYGLIKIESYADSKDKIKLGLIQPDLNPNKKWEIGNLSVQIDLYENLSIDAIKEGAELIIWPETALPVYLLTQRYEKETRRIQDFVEIHNTPILTGMPHAVIYNDLEKAPQDAKLSKNTNTAYTSYNSILFFTPENEVEKYAKIKLVPFGEKVPLVDAFPILGKWIKWNVGISSWNTGKDTLVFNWEKASSDIIKIGGVICIESIYPDFVAAFVEKGADFIAVVTNDSWYGNSSGPYQHKEISVLRAVENRRTVVRAANGGITCIIDPLGRTISNTEMFTRDILVGDVELSGEETFFTDNALLLPNISIIITTLTLILIILNIYKKSQK